MPNGESNGSPIISEFARDPDMAELVELFVSELPQRVDALHRAWSDKQVQSLTTLAHQLRGASAGYGFPTIGKSAERLELDLKALNAAGPSPDLSAIAQQFNDLVELCNRVRPT
jgi:HPt (histidine-containing phosphotransfer) domain-containing protein